MPQFRERCVATRARTRKCAWADDLRESALPRKRPSATAAQHVVMGHVWTVPAVQEESDFSAKRSGAAMYTAYCRLEDYLCRDAATVAAGPDVIR
jgi:hypothetical protein